ncbi:MAG: AbrB/MazE/SpoVT family DNA-binding domain-containing protein [Candidatus Heimdallarchaeota archaeon]
MSKGFKVKRKITFNSGVYKLTIPKSFIENLDLSPDDEVTLIYKDENTLIISTKND